MGKKTKPEENRISYRQLSSIFRSPLTRHMAINEEPPVCPSKKMIDHVRVKLKVWERPPHKPKQMIQPQYFI